ncbi:hypothetical protein [uncultured Azohydromonas sp.]|jgi:hypothetical protein|uniref:hypothetical protein n=1 Tax=uncultured Azohydromonas sp. TaxID=487342 RepID=UPI0026382672|nr:hypothetical protein [uncultured Azohydromonas sp.]
MDVATLALLIATPVLGVAVFRLSRKTDQVLTQLNELKALLSEPGGVSHAPAEAREPDAVRPAQDISAEELQPTQLYFCTSDGKMVLGIKKLEIQQLARFTRSAIRGSESRLATIKGVLQASPSVLTHAGIEEGQLMEVVLNGPLAASCNGDALLAMVRGAGGKVVEQSRVRNLPSLAPLPASAVAATAKALAGQHYLDGINSMLVDLGKGLAEVRDTQSTELKAALAEVVNFLYDKVLGAVRRGHLPPALMTELQAAEARLVKVQQELVQLHRMLNQRTKHLRRAGEFDPDEMFKALSDHAKAVDALRKQFVWTVQARLTVLQFEAMFVQDPQVLQPRRQAIAESMQTPELGTGFEPLIRALVEELDSLDETLSDDKTLGHRKAALKVFVQQAFENTRTELAEAGKVLEESVSQGTTGLKPIRLAIRIDKGRVEGFELAPRRVAAAPAPQPSAATA